MKLNPGIAIIAALTLFSLVSKAQYAPKFSADTLTKVYSNKISEIQAKGKFIYMLAERGSVPGTRIRSVVKLDTSGKQIWAAYPKQYALYDSIPFMAPGRNLQLIQAKDNHLYLLTSCDTPSFTGSVSRQNFVSKINDKNGDVVWTRKIKDYGLNQYRMHISDYTDSTMLAYSYRGTNRISILLMSKLDGRTIQTRNFNVVDNAYYESLSAGSEHVYVSDANNLYILASDSCYKYASFESPAPQWRKKYGSLVYGGNIKTIFEDSGTLIIAGKMQSSGLVTALNMDNGTTQWQHRYEMGIDVTNIDFGDIKLKGDFIYTTWEHSFVGSISEKCYVNCANRNTGTTVWEKNFDFNYDTTTYEGDEQAMLSLDVDDNFMVYLTGYANKPGSASSFEWCAMKVNGLTGTLLHKYRVPNLYNTSAYPSKGQFIKLYGNKLYSLGFQHNGTSISDYSVNIILQDTSTLHLIESKSPHAIQLQHHSITHGIADFSESKKVVVKNIGKSLQVELVNNNFTPIWTKDFSDSEYLYEGSSAVGVSLNRHIFFAVKRFTDCCSFSGIMFNEFHERGQVYADTTFVFELDSTGNLINKYAYYDGNNIIPGSITTDTFLNKTNFSFFCKNSAFGPYVSSDNIGGAGIVKVNNGRVPFLKPRNGQRINSNSFIRFGSEGLYYTSFNKYFLTGGYVQVKLLNTRVIYDVEKIDSIDVCVVGQDSLNGNDFIMKYNCNTPGIVWRNNFDTFRNSIKSYALGTSLYVLVKKGKSYFIECYGQATGNLVWSQAIPVPTNTVFAINDFILNRYNNRFSVAGNVSDTTMPFHHSIAYAYTFNPDGTEFYKFSEDGYLSWMNGCSFLFASGNTTLTGGTLNHEALGYASFIMAADQEAAYATIRNGNWNDPASWVDGVVPPPYAKVIVRNNIVVTTNTSCYTLRIQSPGNLTVNPGIQFNVTH